jgi:hypothetical protein
MARPVSTKTLALRALDDPAVGNPTKLVALQAARAHLSFEEYGRHLRQLAAVVRGRTLRLCLLALAEHEAQERTHTQSQANASQRAEIDAILAECAREQGSKANPESVESVIVEPQPVAPSVPVDEVSSEARSRSQVARSRLQSQPAVRIPDLDERSDTKREELLAKGRTLETDIRAQLGIMSQAPLHWHAGQKKLEQLQADFLAWERAMNADYPGFDTSKEFPDNRLRFFMKIVDQRGYFAQRRAATIDEQAFIAAPPERAKAAHSDSGFWGGIPAGI